MCGIAGLLTRDSALLSKIGDMTRVQAHRGPDGMGHLLLGADAKFSGEGRDAPRPGDFLALGHLRLAIIDRSEGGLQPMQSADGGGDWIVYNGEIYNYVELRDELRQAGFEFRSDSDTEVILAAYRAWGTACFQRFNGMWSIALWDSASRKLVFSRDRFGVKPLYFAAVEGGLAFSSEIKAIFATDRLSPVLRPDIVADFLRWSVVDHRDATFFEGVHSFPPGCFALVDPEERTVTPQRYWSLDDTPAGAQPGLERPAAMARFAELFRDAVRLRLRSDVPVGSCLSGGLDSSAIVCQAAALREPSSPPFHTFNAGSVDPRFDEGHWADLVSGSVGSQAHRVVPTAGELAADFDDLVWHQEQPFTTASIYAQWRVMKEARANRIPVLLDGQGADEVLCGYRKFYVFYLKELAASGRWVQLAREVASLALRGDRGFLRWREGVRYLPAFLRGRLPGLRDLMTQFGQSAWDASEVALSGGATVTARQIDDLTRFSVPSLLRYEDRNSMAWAIEARVPFLDYRLASWLVSLPPHLKMAGGRTKALMRDALRGLVPDAILDRRDKMGFVTAQEEWMRGELKPVFEKTFSDLSPLAATLVDSSKVQVEYAKWAAGDSSLSHNDFFRVFVLERWIRRFNVGGPGA